MNIFIYTLKSVAFALTEPYMAFLLLMITFVLYRRNVKTSMMQKMVMGDSLDNPFELTISQVVIGIFAGTIGSLILSFLGVVFDQSYGIELLFLASVLFMFYNPRFVCFAYSGAILGGVSLIFTFIAYATGNGSWDFLKLDITAILTMVAVLHFVEGIVVFVDGKRGSMPVFTNRDNKIIGGFAMQRYWAIPVAIFFLVHDKTLVASATQVPLPDWWPMIKTSIPLETIKNAVLMLIPFFGVIGYSSITFTKNQKSKIRESSAFLIGYSVVLFGLAQLAQLNLIFKIFALLFAIGAHEGMILFQRKNELTGKPKYVSDGEGVMVLEVVPDSPAFEMGIKSGDTLVRINDKEIETEQVIDDTISDGINFLWFNVKKENGDYKQVSYNKMNYQKKLGLVLVPKSMPKESMVVKLDGNSFKDVLNKIKKKDNDD